MNMQERIAFGNTINLTGGIVESQCTFQLYLIIVTSFANKQNALPIDIKPCSAAQLKPLEHAHLHESTA
jgi:hypothetical protein